MTKDSLLELIDKFESETYQFKEQDDIYDGGLKYLYAIGREIQKSDGSNLEPLYNKIISIMGIIRFKYGFESEIISSCPDLQDLKIIIDSFQLDSADVVNQYNYILTMYNNYTNNMKNVDFIDNNYTNIQGKEGLYLAIESLKSLISNPQYRQFIDLSSINDVLIDLIKLNRDYNVSKIENKYQEIIKTIWEHSLSNSIDNDEFRILFSNISGGNLADKADMLINRPNQSSCSLISSDFVAIYGSQTRKIGLMYPSNSEIILASAYDLGSNVFGRGAVNNEKGTTLATPEVIEKLGIERAQKNGEDNYSSNCYNEVTVNSKPCGIVLVGLGEMDLNIYYQEALDLSKKMNLPIYFVDTMKYKEQLSEADKEYIAFHVLATYLNIPSRKFTSLNSDYEIGNFYEIMDAYKNQIADIFLKLKENGNLSKDNMFEVLNSVIDLSLTNNQIDNEFETHKSL